MVKMLKTTLGWLKSVTLSGDWGRPFYLATMTGDHYQWPSSIALWRIMDDFPWQTVSHDQRANPLNENESNKTIHKNGDFPIAMPR